MGFPRLSSGRIDPQLSEILLAYTNPSFLADQILPTVPDLSQEAGHIGKMGNSHLRQYSTKRSVYDEGEHRIEFTISNDQTYQIDYFDQSAYVPDRVQNQVQLPFNALNAAQFTVMDAMKLEREIALAAVLTDTSKITQNTTLAGNAQYTDQANSNPEVDFDTARDAVQVGIGREANAVLMSRKVMNALRRHPFFIEIAKFALAGGAGKAGTLSESAFMETLKSWYELDYVFIGRTIKVTSQTGQTETKGQVWGNDVVFFNRTPSPSLFAPSFGYSFQLAGQNLQTRVRRHVNDKGDIVEVLWAYQDLILDTNAAFLIKNAVS